MTNLIKHDDKHSFFPTTSLGKQIDHFFGDFFSNMDRNIFKNEHNKNIRVNLSEDDKAYYVDAMLAGFKKEDVKLNCKHNILSIEATRENKKEESKKNYYYSEYSGDSFYRSFSLPEHVNSNKIEAEMKDGLLKITLPKSEDKTSSSTNITIR